jgi:hypothetical protein
MKRYGLVMAAVALVVVGGITLIPAVGTFVLGPIAAFFMGGLAAALALRSPAVAKGDGGRIALIAGAGAFIGTVAACAALGMILSSFPSIQEAVRMSEPHPEARVPFEWMESLGAAAGTLVGLLVGAANLVLSLVGGLVGGTLVRHGSAPVQAGRAIR